MTDQRIPVSFPATHLALLGETDDGVSVSAGYRAGYFTLVLGDNHETYGIPPKVLSALLLVITRQRACERPTTNGEANLSGYATVAEAPCVRIAGHTGQCTAHGETSHRYDDWWCGDLTSVGALALTPSSLRLPCLRRAGHAGGHSYDEERAKAMDAAPPLPPASLGPTAIPSKLEERVAALEESIAGLVELVGKAQDSTAELLEVVNRPAAPLPVDVATTDYVAQELKRLSAAMHDHVTRVAADLRRALTPAPSRLRGVLAALFSSPASRIPWPHESSPAAIRGRRGRPVDPEDIEALRSTEDVLGNLRRGVQPK